MSVISQTDLSQELLQKYSVSIPRYTSYPTAPEWTEHFSIKDYLNVNKIANEMKTPISLYFHLPFCESQCYFCACNIVISKKKSVTNPYLEHIKKEIKTTGNLIDKNRKVEQIHMGGGTPTYFSPDELEDFYKTIKENFNVASGCEIGIEVDPRVTSYNHLQTLSKLGFNRLSMGIQDFDYKVQESINRIQPFEDTNRLFKIARDFDFNSINVDLIYGLPFQTKDGFAKTIDLIINLSPDRIALFHYAHLPQMIKHQFKYIPQNHLPSSDSKIEIFQYAVKALTKSGYSFIGLDHFAKPDDELAQARLNKTLHRNFQGYTTKAGCDLYGFGITAISNIQNTFSQNIKKLNLYYEKLNLSELPILKGIVLNNDDLIRKDIIMRILCHGFLIKSEIEKLYQIKFDDYFYSENEVLKKLQTDGLVKTSKNEVEITSTGQFFLRNIACTFDFYLQNKNGKQKIYSKSV